MYWSFEYRYQDVAVGNNPDFIKEESKAKFSNFRAGNHEPPVDYAHNFTWSVHLVRRLLQGETIDEFHPPTLVPIKRERRAFSRMLSRGSSSNLIDLTSPAKKPRTSDDGADPEDRSLNIDALMAKYQDEIERSELEEGLAGFLHDLEVEDENMREMGGDNAHESD